MIVGAVVVAVVAVDDVVAAFGLFAAVSEFVAVAVVDAGDLRCHRCCHLSCSCLYSRWDLEKGEERERERER